MTRRIATAIILVATLAASALVSGCRQEDLIFFPERLSPDYRFHFSGRFEERVIPVNGATLHALHFRAARTRGVVLYFHGNAGSLGSWGGVAEAFTRRAFDVLILDYRGFGKSSGHIASELELLEDCSAAYETLRKDYAERDIIVYGRSIGTGPAAFVAQRFHPRLLVLETPYTSMADLAEYHYPWVPRVLIDRWLKYRLPTETWVRNTSCPVVLLHGMRDDIIPDAASRRMAAQLGQRCRLIRFPGGGHNNLEDHPAYARAMDEILR